MIHRLLNYLRKILKKEKKNVSRYNIGLKTDRYNTMNIAVGKVVKNFEGDLSYVGTFDIKEQGPYAVFHNKKPNREKGHKDFLLIRVLPHMFNEAFIAGIDQETMEKERYRTAIRCPDCKDVLFSQSRHHFNSCDCGQTFIDGGMYCVRVGGDPEVGKLDVLTGMAEFERRKK